VRFTAPGAAFALSFTAADVAELDPAGTGTIVLFGLHYTATAIN
jgi:hypothetical protein